LVIDIIMGNTWECSLEKEIYGQATYCRHVNVVIYLTEGHGEGFERKYHPSPWRNSDRSISV
jgi:hypothetical protein